MTAIRRLFTTREVIHAEMGQPLGTSIVRATGIAIVGNPFAGQFAQDLSPLFEVGREVGMQLSAQLGALLDGPAVAYGKGAMVGMAGELEHGGACIHPMLGKPMRQAIGGGDAVIPSNVKIAAPGSTLDVPLGHKDNVWSFDHFDTVTVFLSDGPRADEIAVVLAFADGGRPLARCGTGPR
ncbi:MAG: amino acid synthesis family protein [Hyphomicrobiaceae bacterium]